MRSTRLTTAVLLLAFLPGCTSYQVLADPVASLQAAPKAMKKARVTIDTGRRFEVWSPRLSGDSLQGHLRDGTAVNVPMSGVQEVEIRKFNGTKTGLLVAGGILAALGAAFVYYARVVIPD